MSNIQPNDLRLGLTIGGRSVTSEETSEVIDPASGDAFARVPRASSAQLDEAVDAADEAFTDWSRRPWAERKAVLLAFCDAVEADLDTLGPLVAREAGKPLAKAVGELKGGCFFARGFADLELEPKTLRDNSNQLVRVEPRPLGVVGSIIAWNYPGLLAMWKIAPAVLTGNTMVLKPAPSTPLAALRLGQIASSVFPPGVVNVLSGGDELGRWMSEHPRIRKIAFTGSVATGKAIMAAAAPTLKRLTLELGGNDPAIVLDDFDLDGQIDDLFWAGFANNGQVCACMKRLYVPKGMVDAVGERFAQIASAAKTGPWDLDGVQIGPLQNKKQLGRVQELVEEASAQKAPFYQGQVPTEGFFFPITLYKDLPDECRLVSEEQFGPALAIIGYSHVDEAVEKANATEFGLGASVWGRSVDRATEVASQLRAGNVFVNQHPSMGPEIPYGGIKQSGIGVECGVEGLAEYTSSVVLNVKRS